MHRNCSLLSACRDCDHNLCFCTPKTGLGKPALLQWSEALGQAGEVKHINYRSCYQSITCTSCRFASRLHRAAFIFTYMGSELLKGEVTSYQHCQGHRVPASGAASLETQTLVPPWTQSSQASQSIHRTGVPSTAKAKF